MAVDIYDLIEFYFITLLLHFHLRLQNVRLSWSDSRHRETASQLCISQFAKNAYKPGADPTNQTRRFIRRPAAHIDQCKHYIDGAEHGPNMPGKVQDH